MATSALRSDDGIALYRSTVGDIPGVGLACTGFGVQRIRRWVVDRALDEFAMVFVDEGTGWLETPAGRQPVVAPALFVLLPGIVHAYGPDEGTAWHERWALFSGPLAEAFAAAGLLDPAPVKIAGALEIIELFNLLHRDFVETGPLGPAAAAASLHRLIMGAAMQRRRIETQAARDKLDDAIELVRRQAFGPVDLVSLPRSFGLAPATFRRRVHVRLGLSPKALIAQIRTSRAKELLAVTDLSITEVARAVGYDDPYYFARVFGAREKLTPSEFRRRNQRA